jgi:hypothetical protein
MIWRVCTATLSMRLPQQYAYHGKYQTAQVESIIDLGLMPDFCFKVQLYENSCTSIRISCMSMCSEPVSFVCRKHAQVACMDLEHCSSAHICSMANDKFTSSAQLRCLLHMLSEVLPPWCQTNNKTVSSLFLEYFFTLTSF